MASASSKVASRSVPAGSLWLAGRAGPRFEPLAGEQSFDAVVLGAGITGLCTALALGDEGLNVAVVEQQWIGAGATGLTSAKLSSLQGTRYSKISSRLGSEVAHDYAAANEQGIAEIRRLCAEHGVDCDLRERSNYVYGESDKDLSKLEKELDSARQAGLAVEWADQVPLPVETKGGIRLDRQAEFHPIKFLDGLADAFAAAGGTIYEKTRALGIDGSEPFRIETDRGKLTSAVVVVATHYPFTDRALLFPRMHPERSYSIGAKFEGEPPAGMFINVSSPTRSIRSHPLEGDEVLIVGGEGHKTGHSGPFARRYETLREFAERHFAVRSVDFGWSTQDNVTVDGAPYIGRLFPGMPGLLGATGYAKWGLAMAPSAARILAALAVERDHPLAESFNPKRRPPIKALGEIAREGADFSLRFASRLVSSAPTCTHMGCPLVWNDAEESWDCPCHGSRFASDGRLLQGPAVDDLPAESLPRS